MGNCCTKEDINPVAFIRRRLHLRPRAERRAARAAAEPGAARRPRSPEGRPRGPEIVPLPCVICEDPCLRVRCRNDHAVCDDCFANQITAWSDPATGGCGAIGPHLTEETIGNVPCCIPDCREAYTCLKIRAVVRTLNLTLDMMPENRDQPDPNAELLHKYSQACRHQREKLQNERERGAPFLPLKHPRNDRSEREIYVEENLLMLRCPNPRCRAPFGDFDGCFAVECAHCRYWFCAWCLDFHGTNDEAHWHVANCPQNQMPDKSVWGSVADFEKFHRKRRVDAVALFLSTEGDPAFSKQIQQLLDRTLLAEQLASNSRRRHKRALDVFDEDEELPDIPVLDVPDRRRALAPVPEPQVQVVPLGAARVAHRDPQPAVPLPPVEPRMMNPVDRVPFHPNHRIGGRPVVFQRRDRF